MTEPGQDAAFYRQMLRIRRFEETALAAFPKGLISGTTHAYIGQEANAVGVLACLEPGDTVVSNHRCHGHFLAAGGPMQGLAAELMGRATGVCAGRSGSQHIHWGDFYANGVLGGTAPLAVGMALAGRAGGQGRITFVFLGEGALGEGVVYESLNMAALWRLPLFFILENNRYAQTTPIELNLAGGILARFRAFAVNGEEVDTTDVSEIHARARDAADSVRSGDGPRALVLHTYRFAPHSKGDDTRDPAEVARFRERDPLVLQAGRLERAEAERIEADVGAEVEAAFQAAELDPPADPASLPPAVEPAA